MGVMQLPRPMAVAITWEELGEHTWQQSGLGAPTDIDALNHKITQLAQQAADL